MKHITDTNLFILTTALVILASWTMTQIFNIGGIYSLIMVHVALGGLAFLIGAITLFSKKGSDLHRLTGRIFYISMVVSVAITLVVSLLPGHVSPTMFHIGVLSLYFLLGGKRSLKFKSKIHRFTIDKLLAYAVISTSLAVIGYTFFMEGRIHPLRTVFGSIGLVFGTLDLWMFHSPENASKKWLFLHLSKMLGGYTAAVTAFFVAQKVLSGYYNWFAPTVVGVALVIYWAFKLNVFQSRVVKSH